MKKAIFLIVLVLLIFALLMVFMLDWEKRKIGEDLLVLPEKATYCENEGIISDKYKILAVYPSAPENETIYEFYNFEGIISYGVCREKELGVVELIEKETGVRFGYVFLQGDRLSLMTEEDVLVLYRGRRDIALMSGKVSE